jgi:transcriptional regulator of acetoin/glycerol metabolism
VILCENNCIIIFDLDLEEIIPYSNNADDFQLSDVEKNTIERVLCKNNYNISKSAEELGLSRAALYRRIEKYDLNNETK